MSKNELTTSMKKDRIFCRSYNLRADILCKLLFVILLPMLGCYSCIKISCEDQEKFKTAIYNNDESYINFILSKGIDLNDENAFGYLPIRIAVLADNIKIIKQFLEYGANVNQRGLLTEDTCLSSSRSVEVAQFLIDNGAEINCENFIKESPLHFFAGRYLDISRLLIKHGADVNKKNEGGQTPIFRSILVDNYETFKLLVDSKADLNIVDNQGSNLFTYFAYSSCDIRIADVLFNKGVSIFHKINNGHNCLMIASRGARRNIEDKKKYVKYFLSWGIDINMQSNVGETALHVAVAYDQYEIAKLLIESGADTTIISNESKTPLQIAIDRGNKEIIKLLSQ